MLNVTCGGAGRGIGVCRRVEVIIDLRRGESLTYDVGSLFIGMT